MSPAELKEYLARKAAKKPKPVKWGQPVKLTESEQQAECVIWFRRKYPEFEKLLWANPNGGYRHKRTAATLSREGVISGVPDITLAVAKNGFHGLYIEQKVKGNTTTANQKEMLKLLSQQGYRCEVVYSTEEFKSIIQDYLK